MSNIPNIPNQKDYKNLTPFDLVLIQKFPFIEEDFDAVNLYGILSKIKDYLNNVIANEQIVTENQQNVYNSFVGLHDYVQNYFDNLDVQEEINNKLDEMAESGELQNIIAMYLDLNVVINFNTINDLKNASNISVNNVAITKGYYAVNDGGSAKYLITDNNTNVDEYFKITLQNGLYGELIIENDTVNILQLGGKKQDTSNNLFDNKPVIDAFLSYSSNIKQTNLYIPNGIFAMTPVTITQKNIKIIGNSNFTPFGTNSTILIPYTSNQSHIIKIDTTNQIVLENIMFSTGIFEYNNVNKNFECANYKYIQNECLNINKVSFSRFTNLFFINIYGKALKLYQSFEINFNKIEFRKIDIINGDIFEINGGEQNVSACIFENLNFESTHGNLIAIYNTFSNNIINNITFEDYEFQTVYDEYGNASNSINENNISHQAVIKFDATTVFFATNIINNISLNNFSRRFTRQSDTYYIYDTIFNYTGKANLKLLCNNINLNGCLKTFYYFLQQVAQTFTHNWIKINNTYNDSNQNGLYNLKGWNKVLSDSYGLNYNGYNRKGNGLTEAYKIVNPDGAIHGNIILDTDTINQMRLAIRSISSENAGSNRVMSYCVAESQTILIRAKATENSTQLSFFGSIGRVNKPLTRDGQYHWYTVDLTNCCEIGDNLQITSYTDSEDEYVAIDCIKFV